MGGAEVTESGGNMDVGKIGTPKVGVGVAVAGSAGAGVATFG